MNTNKVVLKKFRVTEKATDLSANLNKYTFVVADSANKTEVAQAVAREFGKKVVKVNILNNKGKLKTSRTQRNSYGIKNKMRKAVVTLAKGETIEMA